MAREMQIKIDEITMSRYTRLFADGDYAGIGRIANTTRATVSVCFKKGTAPVSLARAMKAFYEEKEAIAKELAQ